MTTNNIFGNDILNGDLATSLAPELGQEDISLNLNPESSSFIDPLTEEISLTEPETLTEETQDSIDHNFPFNNSPDIDNLAPLNIDPLTGDNPEESPYNDLDLNDTSFAPPQSKLDFLGGFGDYEGGNDITLEIKDNSGNVVETFALSGAGQATLYSDQESQYIFFSGVDETTKVDIDSISNIKFGDYLGDSLTIETTGSIDGGDIVLNDDNTEVDSGLILRAGIDTENSVGTVFDGYTLVDFDTHREMVDINYYGQIVGNDTFSGTETFFFYDGSRINYLPGYESSRAFGINDYSQMIGEGVSSTSDDPHIPFLVFGNGTVEEFTYSEGGSGRFSPNSSGADVIYDYDPLAYPRDINNFVEIASYQLNTLPEEAPPELQPRSFEDSYFLAPGGASVNIGYELLESDDSRAFGINDPGQVVGINRETNRAFIFNRADNPDDHSVTSLGTLPGGDYSAAYAINNVGQVVGVSTSAAGSRAFIYENEIMKDLGVSYVGDPGKRVGIDINNLGQVVVTSAEGQPFVYQDGVVTNINDWLRPEVINLGYTITEAKGINDRGQIIAQGTYEGTDRGLLLNPTFQEVNRNINVGNIYTSGETVLLEGAEVYLEGTSIVTQGGNITFDGQTKVSDNLIIDSSVTQDELIRGGNLTFTKTLDAASANDSSVAIAAATGDVIFGDTVGGDIALANLIVNNANQVTALSDLTVDNLLRINAIQDIAANNVLSENGSVRLGSQQGSIAALDITSGKDEDDNLVLRAGDSISTANLLANELGVVRIISGQLVTADNDLLGDVTTASITGKRIRVDSGGKFVASEDLLTYEGNLVINAAQDITTANIMANQGTVRLISAEKSITAQDITSGTEENNNLVLQAGDSVTVKNLLANELGVVRIASGTVLEADETANVAGDISTESITGKRVRVKSTGNFTATGDAFTHDGNVVVDAKQDLTIENITANNGNVRLTSEEKSITVQDITTVIPEVISDDEMTRNGNIILKAVEDISASNLDAGESGRVSITAGEIVENETETLEDDTIIVADISTESITGKAVRAVGTGSFTATGDITAHDGSITIAVTNDVNTKGINSLAKSISVISTDGAVTVDGDLNAEKGGVAIHGANDISTQKIRSFDGAITLSSYDGKVIVEDDINTVRGGVTIAAKEGVEVARITTGIGQVNIGSGKSIVASGDISTNVGYVNLKAGGNLDVQNVTTNDGYISLGADINVEVQSLSTNSGVINLISATGGVAVAGSINTEGSYVAIEAVLDIIASAIEANGGGIDLIANSDFGGIGLIATNPNTSDVNADVIENLNDLSSEQAGAFSEIISDVIYYSRPVGEFLLGVLYGTAANNLGEAFEIGQFFLPLKLSERDRRYWTQVINSQSTAFKLGIELANAGSIVQGIIEIISGGGTFLGGAALCTVGAGATFGISCAAGAPAMVTGAAVSAHGLSLIKNGIENNTDANLIDDLLAPQRMASNGGANAARGLAKQYGLNRSKVRAGLEVLEPKEFTKFKTDIDGQGADAKNLFKPLLNKSESIIKKVLGTYKSVGGDADAVSDIQRTLLANKRNNKGVIEITDTQLEDAFSDNLNFLQKYKNKVSGAFSYTFGRSKSKTLDSDQAIGEIRTAEDLLDGKALLKSNGTGQSFIGEITSLTALSDARKPGGSPKIPDHLITEISGATRLVEVKTPTKKMLPRRIKNSVKSAVEQIVEYNTLSNPSDKGIIRLDYRSSTAPSDLSISTIEKAIKDRLDVVINTTNNKKGSDFVDFVEVIYEDSNQLNSIQRLVIKVN